MAKKSRLMESIIEDQDKIKTPLNEVPKESEIDSDVEIKQAPVDDVGVSDSDSDAKKDAEEKPKKSKEDNEAFARMRRENEDLRKRNEEFQRSLLELSKPKAEPTVEAKPEYKDFIYMTPEEQNQYIMDQAKKIASDQIKPFEQLQDEMRLQKESIRWQHEKGSFSDQTKGAVDFILNAERQQLKEQNPTAPQYWIDEQITMREATTIRQLKEQFANFPNSMALIKAFIHDAAENMGYAYKEALQKPQEQRQNLNERREMKEKATTLNGLGAMTGNASRNDKDAQETQARFLNAPLREAAKMNIKKALQEGKR